jgi:hypothetical protein
MLISRTGRKGERQLNSHEVLTGICCCLAKKHPKAIRILRKHGRSGMKEARCPEQLLTVRVVRLSAEYV